MPLKVREIIKMVESDGWSLARTRGSHRQYVHPTKRGVVTIAGNPSADLPRGTERSIPEADGTVMGGATMSGYAIVVEQAEDGGYGAWSPEVPGCVALGATVDETVAEMRVAIKLHLELLAERGEPLPLPTAVRVDLLAA